MPDYDKVLSFISYGGNYYNAYGPTETCICASIFGISKGTPIASKTIPIGRPVSNTSIYILDGNLQLVPVGVIGELCIGGVQLADGYLNLPGLTSEKFVEHPFIAGERMYRTGDMARWLPDGNIEFMGRRDDQVKIRGHRIELGEIESVLGQLDGVRQSVVLAREDESGTKQLVAYVVCEWELDPSSIRDALGGKLPDYMVPNLYMFLDKIPLTSSGKIDRSALPYPAGASHGNVEYVAPSTNEEMALAAVWESVLGRENIGIRDNFFELGGNSLLAMKLSFAITKAFEIKVDIKIILKYPTIKLQSQYLDIVKSSREQGQSINEETVYL